MKVESTGFTSDDLAAFASDLLDHERLVLADRLEAGSARLAGVVARLERSEASDGEEWSAHDILAHIAVFSKFYGVLTYKVGSGQATEIDLLNTIQGRDVIGQRAARHSAAELLSAIQADHQRTVAYLRAADAAAMRRRIAVGNGVSMSTEQIARLMLVAHLEQHVNQLEKVIEEWPVIRSY